jgi:hypothetical protein
MIAFSKKTINYERAGKFKTNLSGETAYRSFLPSPLQPLAVDDEMLSLKEN